MEEKVGDTKHFFLYGGIKKISDLFEKITAYFTGSLVFIMLIIVLLQILSRTFGSSFSWTEELSRYLLIWIGVLAASIALKKGAHAGVDFFIERFPVKLINIVSIFTSIVMLFFLVYFTKFGWEAAVKARNITSTALEIKMFWPKAALPVGGVLMIINLIYLIAENIDQLLNNRKGGM